MLLWLGERILKNFLSPWNLVHVYVGHPQFQKCYLPNSRQIQISDFMSLIVCVFPILVWTPELPVLGCSSYTLLQIRFVLGEILVSCTKARKRILKFWCNEDQLNKVFFITTPSPLWFLRTVNSVISVIEWVTREKLWNKWPEHLGGKGSVLFLVNNIFFTGAFWELSGISWKVLNNLFVLCVYMCMLNGHLYEKTGMRLLLPSC